MKDDLGNRMKEQYENRTRYYLPRRTYTIIRVDGKAFHTFTKSFQKPFDSNLIYAMNETAKGMCEEIEGSQFAFVQSDEISILVTDFSKTKTQAWFDGNLQKICSVSASMATAIFNYVFNQMGFGLLPACFDSRVFTIPDAVEVENYFVWRQKDWTRNSIQLVGQAHFSHKELHGKSQADIQDMLMLQKGVNWNDYATRLKRGRIVKYMGKDISHLQKEKTYKWLVDSEIPVFTQNRDYLRELIPTPGYD